ncbi:tail fiber assembly protein [Martelella alba]|uniref:Tail fiber assembly protein n=1 Tax=Martelella alba TaxID=2590451 RepID=A0ABY2SRD9_9HYPH|nr:tail fiber assembly protein [Martelella alba]TKI08674.1 tail fiber assembly protein [Martelella alba]
MSDQKNAVFDDNKIATQAGMVTVFHFDTSTGEFLCQSEEYCALGVGIPACSCLDAPPGKVDNQAIVRSDDNSSWSVMADYRGVTVYNTQTLATEIITAIGPLSDNVTTSSPATPYDKWDGSKWVTDTDAQRAADIAVADTQKTALIASATEQISILQDAVNLEMATDAERAQLTALQSYRVLLNRVDTSTAPNIQWLAVSVPATTSTTDTTTEVNNG